MENGTLKTYFSLFNELRLRISKTSYLLNQLPTVPKTSTAPSIQFSPKIVTIAGVAQPGHRF